MESCVCECGCVAVELAPGLVVKVSPEDLERIKRYRWYQEPRSGYARRTISLDGHSHSLYMHRAVLDLTNIKGQYKVVDHEDGDRLHNGRHNLRVCTPAENNRNRRKPERQNKTSQYKGVSLDSAVKGKDGKVYQRRKPWRARIVYELSTYYLGAFRTEREAAEAYNQAALDYYGKYARLNELPVPEEPVLESDAGEYEWPAIDEGLEAWVREQEIIEEGRYWGDPFSFEHLKWM